LLARATERRREIAVRLALGAGRFRVVRQLLAESLTLSIGGGLFGLVFAFWLVKIAASVKPPVDLPLVFELHVDYRVFIFTVIISLLTCLLFGLLPALQATKTDLIPALKDENAFSGYRRSWMKDALIVLQIALSLVLLISGGLMLRGLQRAQTLKLGFDPENEIEVSFDLRLQGYNSAQGRELQKDLLARVRSLPGVKYAGIADMIPVDLHLSRSSVFIEGAEPQRGATAPRALTNVVSPGYFQAMSTRLVNGRDFTEQDNETAIRAAIVNETFAKTFWPGEEALGKRLSLGRSDPVKLEVIGVTEDGKYTGLNEAPRPFVYRSIFQPYSGATSLIVRTEYDPNKMLSAVRGEVQQVDFNMPLSNARTLNDRMSLPLLPARLAASVFGGFGLLALMLATIGIYGVMFYSVLRRTHEIGVRMALGAQKSDIMKLVMGQGTILLLIGIGVGLAAAVALTSFMKSLLYGISATDPMTFTVITALLALAALLASYLPARRAIKVDPVIALRCE
jgi:macrolide transport system ATP-binding/permease protein